MIESEQDIPFSIKRVYFLYDVPSGSERGGHAHKALESVLVAISGSFDVLLDDGKRKKTVPLNRPNEGLYICPLIWREINNFSSGAICLVVASAHYDREDYYYDYSRFQEIVLAHV